MIARDRHVRQLRTPHLLIVLALFQRRGVPVPHPCHNKLLPRLPCARPNQCANSGKVVLIPYQTGFSTTDIIERVIAAYTNP